MQALQLLSTCEGAPLAQMRKLLGDEALRVVMETRDPVQAALALSNNGLLGTLTPQVRTAPHHARAPGLRRYGVEECRDRLPTGCWHRHRYRYRHRHPA